MRLFFLTELYCIHCVGVVLLFSTWQNQQLSDDMIRQLDERGLTLAKERQVFVGKLGIPGNSIFKGTLLLSILVLDDKLLFWLVHFIDWPRPLICTGKFLISLWTTFNLQNISVIMYIVICWNLYIVVK